MSKMFAKFAALGLAAGQCPHHQLCLDRALDRRGIRRPLSGLLLGIIRTRVPLGRYTH